MQNLLTQRHAQLATQLQLLPDKPEETPETTLRALWLLAAGQPMSAQQAAQHELPELSATQQQSLQQLIAQRLDGVPLAHLTGRARFMGMEMLTDATALVPRMETEILARGAIACAQTIPGDLTIIDVCTGSGNVALACAQQISQAQVFAADLSADAVALAQRNAAHLGLAARVTFRCGDLLAPFDQPDFLGRVDLLTCNPPYISSAKVDQMPAEISAHEPRLAFDGGAFGIAILMRLIAEAPRFLRPGGWLCFEVGLGQGAGMIKRLEKTGLFHAPHALQDSAGQIRAITAQYSQAS